MVSRFPFYKPYYRVGAGPEIPTVRPRWVGDDPKVHNYGAVDCGTVVPGQDQV